MKRPFTEILDYRLWKERHIESRKENPEISIVNFLILTAVVFFGIFLYFITVRDWPLILFIFASPLTLLLSMLLSGAVLGTINFFIYTVFVSNVKARILGTLSAAKSYKEFKRIYERGQVNEVINEYRSYAYGNFLKGQNGIKQALDEMVLKEFLEMCEIKQTDEAVTAYEDYSFFLRGQDEAVKKVNQIVLDEFRRICGTGQIDEIIAGYRRYRPFLKYRDKGEKTMIEIVWKEFQQICNTEEIVKIITAYRKYREFFRSPDEARNLVDEIVFKEKLPEDFSAMDDAEIKNITGNDIEKHFSPFWRVEKIFHPADSGEYTYREIGQQPDYWEGRHWYPGEKIYDEICIREPSESFWTEKLILDNSALNDFSSTFLSDQNSYAKYLLFLQECRIYPSAEIWKCLVSERSRFIGSEGKYLRRILSYFPEEEYLQFLEEEEVAFA